MILEGIITTTNPDGTVNITPLGPHVDDQFSVFVLKPFCTATTYQNVKRTRQAVFHVTDDVELIAQTAVGDPLRSPRLFRSKVVEGYVLADACRWFALRVRSIDDRQERVEINCEVVDRGTIREFFGFNRAKHSVLEAAILATRTEFLAADYLLSEMKRLAVIVTKTGGEAEHRAFRFLEDYIQAATTSSGKKPRKTKR